MSVFKYQLFNISLDFLHITKHTYASKVFYAIFSITLIHFSQLFDFFCLPINLQEVDIGIMIKNVTK